jgi:hypothetical protein
VSLFSKGRKEEKKEKMRYYNAKMQVAGRVFLYSDLGRYEYFPTGARTEAKESARKKMRTTASSFRRKDDSFYSKEGN